MTVQKVITRKAAGEIKDLLMSLSGDGPDPEKLQRMYIAHFTHRLMELIHKNFMKKSKGGTDDLGNKWKKLAASTIQAKLRKRSKLASQIESHPSLRGLSPSQRKTKSQILARQAVPIGIDNGDLEKSYRAGSVFKYLYRPPKTQRVETTATGLIISSDVPHAKHFHRVRQIYPGPKKMRPWLIEAARYARDKVLKEIKGKL